jgi:electron transfer flavoprotein alpha subunit
MVAKAARPQMATVRPKTLPAAERNDSRQGKVVMIEDKIDPSVMKIKVMERIKEEVEGVKLEDAEVVVSGGRGIGSKQNFEMVKELARRGHTSGL